MEAKELLRLVSQPEDAPSSLNVSGKSLFRCKGVALKISMEYPHTLFVLVYDREGVRVLSGADLLEYAENHRNSLFITYLAGKESWLRYHKVVR